MHSLGLNGKCRNVYIISSLVAAGLLNCKSKAKAKKEREKKKLMGEYFYIWAIAWKRNSEHLIWHGDKTHAQLWICILHVYTCLCIQRNKQVEKEEARRRKNERKKVPHCAVATGQQERTSVCVCVVAKEEKQGRRETVCPTVTEKKRVPTDETVRPFMRPNTPN